MNPGQKQFHDFALKLVQPGREAEITALLEESFLRQNNGTFTLEYMGTIVPKMMELLRPECVEEFKQAAAHMRGQLDGN